jgi:hypothetical protein
MTTLPLTWLAGLLGSKEPLSQTLRGKTLRVDVEEVEVDDPLHHRGAGSRQVRTPWLLDDQRRSTVPEICTWIHDYFSLPVPTNLIYVYSWLLGRQGRGLHLSHVQTIESCLETVFDRNCTHAEIQRIPYISL